MGDHQGNLEAVLLTHEVLEKFDPAVTIMFGTAIGNPKRVKNIGDVVVSSLVSDLTEEVIEGDEFALESRNVRPRQAPPYECLGMIGIEAKEFIIGKEAEHSDAVNLTAELMPDSGSEIFPQFKPLFERIGSSNILIKNSIIRDRMFDVDDRLACLDMESAGFAVAMIFSEEQVHSF